MSSLHISYDQVSDVVYVYLSRKRNDEIISYDVLIDDEIDGEILIDLDAHQKLKGIEIINASERLDADLLAAVKDCAGIVRLSGNE